MSKYTEETMLEDYKALVAKRDATYAKVAPLKEKLENVNALADKYRAEAAELAKQVSEGLGGEDHVALKKEISVLARTLGRKDGPLSVK